MAKKPITVFFLLCLLAGVSSCCKKRIVCEREPLKIAFTGFERSYIRNVMLKRYVKGDTERKKALDSAQFINNTTTTRIPNKPDTLWFSSYTATSGALSGVQYGNDWVLTITALNQSFLIADIYENDNRFEKVPCKDNNTKCANSIKTYSINGFWVESNTLYIKK